LNTKILLGINLASIALIANLTIAKNIRRLNGADK